MFFFAGYPLYTQDAIKYFQFLYSKNRIFLNYIQCANKKHLRINIRKCHCYSCIRNDFFERLNKIMSAMTRIAMMIDTK